MTLKRMGTDHENTVVVNAASTKTTVTFVGRPWSQSEPMTIWDAVMALLRHPVRTLIWSWNWKSALLSSLMRAAIFFAANLVAGWQAALGAAAAELTLRALSSGFYGAVTEAFSTAQPGWAAMVVAMVGLPILNHSTELLVHWLRGTPNLLTSMTISVVFTAISSAFNLYIMRRGVLTVGPTAKTLSQDLCEIPALLASFVTSSPRIIAGWVMSLSPRSEGDIR